MARKATEATTTDDCREQLDAALAEFEEYMSSIIADKDALREVIDREKWEHEHQGKPVVPESDLFNPDAIAACSGKEIDEGEHYRRRKAQLAALSRHIGEDPSIRSKVRPILDRVAEAARPIEAALNMNVSRATAEYNAALANLGYAESELKRFKSETNGRILDAYKRAVRSGDEYGFNEYRRHGLDQPHNSYMIGTVHSSYPVGEVCKGIVADLEIEADARASREAVPPMPGPKPVDINSSFSSTAPWHF